MFKKSFLLIVFLWSFMATAQNNVTICWDVSLSMKDRNVDKEFKFLDNYFSKFSNSEVTLLTFANTVVNHQSYQVKDSDWTTIKGHLLNLQYDGATSYKELPEQIDGETILLFTDGRQNYDDATINFEGKLYVINANPHYDKENLSVLSNLNKGRLINLMYTGTESSSDKKDKMYSGTIYNRSEPEAEIVISIKNTDKTTSPQPDGSYSLKARPGDIIVLSVNGKQLVEKELGENRYNNVVIDYDGVQLEEVVVKSGSENNAFNTGNGNNTDALGYGVQTIKDEDISEITPTISEAIDGKVTGLRKGRDDDISQSVIRGIRSISGNNYPLVIIDGVTLPKSDSSRGAGTPVQLTDFIDPTLVADVKVLKGFAATNRYGSEGSGGVILITTKMAAQFNEGGSKKNTALVNDNYYEGNAISNSEIYTTPYLSQLSKNESVDAMYETYLVQREAYWANPYYFIDVFDFFKERDEGIAERILSNLIEYDNSSNLALKAMLFKLTSEKEYSLALHLANLILETNPQLIQSYLDVAIANGNMGNYQLSIDLLLAIVDGTINPQLNFLGLQNIAENEIKNLVLSHRSKLNISNLANRYLMRSTLDARIVFEWNNPGAEFELQFVNPSKRFFKWEHTINNPDELEDELINGYSIEEFEIEGGDKGQWIINVKYLGNRAKNNNTPTLLKCTVQKNFGKPNQINKVQIIRLYKKGSEELVAKLFTR